MEIRDVITLVLGSNFIIAVATFLTTFLTTKMQIKNAAKQFDKEFEKAIVTYQRERRREVRSEPLLKLRNELALMAVKLDNLVASAQRTHTRMGGTDEEAQKELQEAANDWNSYLKNGGLTQTLFMQYDPELVNRVEEIRKDYQQSYFYHIHFERADSKNLLEAMKVFERNKARIIEVQELINKRLEEL